MGMENNFLLFAGLNYYPSGGWNDFQGSFTDELAARKAAKKLETEYNWWHIFSQPQGKIIARGEC